MIDILCPAPSARLQEGLRLALEGIDHRFLRIGEPLQNRRVLFALTVDDLGTGEETLRLLRFLRSDPHGLDGSVGSLIVDGSSELYTKQLGQEMALAASFAGCLLPGKPLVEGTGSLYNQHILAMQRGLTWEETYFQRMRELVERLDTFAAPKFSRPKLLVIHASERGRSSTLWIWEQLKKKLDFCEIREISLQNGTIHDCRGCSYNACLHFAKNDTCFYGGPISDTVFPAIQDCNVMLFLCPNYNDAVGANITALFNRLTSLLIHNDFYDKYLYGIAVSGYSGSDLVAKQLLGAMCLNKTAMLPPHFCMLQTANSPAAIQNMQNLENEIDLFAKNIRQQILL